MSDALEELEALLPRLPEAVKRQRLGQQLDDAAGKLRTGEQEAKRLAALIALASLLGFDNIEQREQLSEARDEAWKVGSSLVEADEAEDLRQATSRYERDFLPALRTLHRDLWKHWRTVVARDFAPLVQIGEMLGKLDQGSTLACDLANCGAEATSMEQTASAADFLNQVSKFVARRDRLQEQRRAAFGDGAVAAFVNALAESRARLDMVTPEVRAWLDTHDASGRLRVAV